MPASSPPSPLSSSLHAPGGAPPAGERLDVADCAPATLAARLSAAGVPVDGPLARRIFAAVLGRGGDFAHVRGLSKATLALLAERATYPRLQVRDRQVSPVDGFAKYLFTLADAAEVEAVRIPVPCEPPPGEAGEAARRAVGGTWQGRRRKYVVCVSSQAGCALGCAFCATARLGFRRNLRAAEIVGQVLAVRAEADRPIGGVVFMGMGEPLLNLDAVLVAARIFNDCAFGVSADNITLSTAGFVPGIRRLAAERQPFRLAVSLASADPQRRRELMPIERRHPLPELVSAMREWTDATGARVTVAYVCIGGAEGNCTERDARLLGELLHDVPVRLDLIDVNAPDLRPPTGAELSAFRDALSVHLRQPVARRYSGGRDIDAACGMLAAKSAAAR